jgi:hypothetical protein
VASLFISRMAVPVLYYMFCGRAGLRRAKP